MHIALLTFDSTTCTSSNQRAIEFNFAAQSGTAHIALKGLVTGQCVANVSDYLAVNAPYGIDHFLAGFVPVSLVVRREKCAADSSGAASVQITIDGAQSECKSLAVDPFTKANKLDLNVGVSTGQPTDAAELVYDDVSFDID
jgi:hypothetical protein